MRPVYKNGGEVGLATRDYDTPATGTKGNGDEGFATGTDSSWLKLDDRVLGPGFELGRWSFFSCRLPSEQWITAIHTYVLP